MNNFITSVIVLLAFAKAYAQGPPITEDSPMLLGAGSYTVRVISETRTIDAGTAVYVPLMLHYLPTARTEISVNIPYINYNLDTATGSGLADMRITGKYQFYRKDGKAKTFRMDAKTVQTLPTGEKLELMDISMGTYSGYYGVVAGYESLKIGVTSEFGYNWMPDGTMDVLQFKAGVGLPLLEPQYPNNQLNLYFETATMWQTERDSYQLLYAQGIQYARKDVTFDLSYQLPVFQDINIGPEFRRSVFIGARYNF
jgi:hypothetical protein